MKLYSIWVAEDIPNLYHYNFIIKMDNDKRSDIWFANDWEYYCGWLQEKGKPQLVTLLHLAFERDPRFKIAWEAIYSNRRFSDISKREICNFITNYKPHPVIHACKNKTTLNGGIFEDYSLDELIYVMDNGNRYCFTYEEIENLDRNPYTNNRFREKSTLLRGKRKRKEPFEPNLKVRHNPFNPKSTFEFEKMKLLNKLVNRPYTIPIKEIQDLDDDRLIMLFEKIYPNIKDDLKIVPRYEILLKIFNNLFLYHGFLKQINRYFTRLRLMELSED